MTDRVQPGVKHAAFIGLKAFHAFRAAHGPAKVVARVPVIGPVLGLAVVAAATVAGAVDGLTHYDG